MSKEDRSNRHSGESAADELLPLIYEKLRALAGNYIQNEKGYQTLQPTALVHEAYLRLADMDRMDWKGKTHFYAMAATAMRRVLVDRARAAMASKRGSKPVRVVLTEGLLTTHTSALDLLDLDKSLSRLALESSRQVAVAELKLFSGMQIDEIAFTLSISATTVKQEWRVARAWLAADLG